MKNSSPACRTLRFLFIPLFLSDSFPMMLFVLTLWESFMAIEKKENSCHLIIRLYLTVLMEKAPRSSPAIAPSWLQKAPGEYSKAHLVVSVWPCTSDPCRWWWMLSWTPWRQHFLALNPRVPRRSWVRLRQKASPRQKARRLASEKPFSHPGPFPIPQIDPQSSAKAHPQLSSSRGEEMSHAYWLLCPARPRTPPSSTKRSLRPCMGSPAASLSCCGAPGPQLAWHLGLEGKLEDVDILLFHFPGKSRCSFLLIAKAYKWSLLVIIPGTLGSEVACTSHKQGRVRMDTCKAHLVTGHCHHSCTGSQMFPGST